MTDQINDLDAELKAQVIEAPMDDVTKWMTEAARWHRRAIDAECKLASVRKVCGDE